MHILLVAATPFEIAPFTAFLRSGHPSLAHNTLETLVAGIGLVSTSYTLMNAISCKKPDLLLQAGIAGSFLPAHPPGTVVLVKEEVMGDLGVEEQGQFNDLFDMGLQVRDQFPFSGHALVNPHLHHWQWTGLPAVNSVSVNEITTRAARIDTLRQKYQAGIESMEGAAFHYLALQEKIPFLQLRAVSNFVGERNKKQWKIKEAIEQLNHQLLKIVVHE